MSNFKFLITASILSIGLYGCGGSNSSTASTTPTPPPAPTPAPPPPLVSAAPVITINSAGTSADEGQPQTLDASQTDDPDNDNSSLTFSWTQLSGNPAQIMSPNAAITQIIRPEIVADETISFQLSVSDGQNTVTETIDLSVVNIFQSPRADVTFANVEITQNLTSGSRVIENGQSLSSPSASPTNGANQFSTIATMFQPLEATIAVPINNIFIADDVDTTLTTSSVFTTFEFIYAASESDNRVSTFVTDAFTPDFNQAIGGYDISAPCALGTPANGNNFFPIQDPSGGVADINIVGQRNSGFEIVAPTFPNPLTSGSSVTSALTLQSVGSTESYCFVQYIESSSVPTNIADDAPLEGIIIAIDFNSNTADLYVDNVDNSASTQDTFQPGVSLNPNYQLAMSMPLLPQGDEGLNIINVQAVELNGRPALLALASDGNHNGEHRAVLISAISAASNAITGENALDLSRTVLSWDLGVPQNAALANAGQFLTIPTLVINSSTSPEAIVFQSPAELFEGPSFFELGLDVESISFALFNSALSQALVVNAPDRNVLELRVD